MGASLDVAHCTGNTTCNECGCEADERDGERGRPAPVPDHYQDELCHRTRSYEKSSFGLAPPPMALPLAVRSAPALPEEWDADTARLPGGPGSTRFLAEEAALLMYVSKRVPLDDPDDRPPQALHPWPQAPQRMASAASAVSAAPPSRNISAPLPRPPSPPAVHRLQSPGPQRMATSPGPQGVATGPLQGLFTSGAWDSPRLACRAASSLTPPRVYRSASVEPIQGVSTARRMLTVPQRYMSAPGTGGIQDRAASRNMQAPFSPPIIHRLQERAASAKRRASERAASAPTSPELPAGRALGPPDVVIRTTDEFQSPAPGIGRMTTNGGPGRLFSVAVPFARDVTEETLPPREYPAMERAAMRAQSPRRAHSPQPLEGLSSAPGSDIRRMSSSAAAARNMQRSSTWDVAGLEERDIGNYVEPTPPAPDVRRMTTSEVPFWGGT